MVRFLIGVRIRLEGVLQLGLSLLASIDHKWASAAKIEKNFQAGEWKR
jgi:hypothetical protein